MSFGDLPSIPSLRDKYGDPEEGLFLISFPVVFVAPNHPKFAANYLFICSTAKAVWINGINSQRKRAIELVLHSS